MIERILSGGQTGVDRAALDAAMGAGIECGGWCPRGRRTEDGTVPSHYPLRETESADYRVRTRLNVVDADGTLILLTGALSGGTALTRQLALAAGKPLLIIDLDSPAPLSEVCSWVRGHHVRTINIAGPRESQRPGIGRRASKFLSTLFSALNVAVEQSSPSGDVTARPGGEGE